MFKNVNLAKKREQRMAEIRQLAEENRTFDSVESMDRCVEKIVLSFELSENAMNVLTALAQHSLNAFGVSWATVERLAARIEKTERTVHRGLSELLENGIIERISTGFKKVSLTVIKPLFPDVTEPVAADVSEDVTHISLALISNNETEEEDINPRMRETYSHSSEIKRPETSKAFIAYADKHRIVPALRERLFQAARDTLSSCRHICIDRALAKLSRRLVLGNVPCPAQWFAAVLSNESAAEEQRHARSLDSSWEAVLRRADAGLARHGRA